MKKFIVCFFVMILGSMPLMAQEERGSVESTRDALARFIEARLLIIPGH